MSSGESEGTCLLNTTECMLQALTAILSEVREQSSQYSWDPLTFALTLVIGIVAIFFAALTIAQGLLAAGPGRLKSSRYAIGPWSRFTRRQFDWQELRFRSVAETPVITPLGRMIELLDGEPSRDKTFSDGYFPATWLSLLTMLDLADPNLWERKPTGADYLPAELPAAPAYGSIEVLVTLGVVASQGRAQIVMDTKLPIVRGPGFELRFRRHPLLGTVAVFEQYIFGPSGAGPLFLCDTSAALLYSAGVIPLDGFKDATYPSRKITLGSGNRDLAIPATSRTVGGCPCALTRDPEGRRHQLPRCCDSASPSVSWPTMCSVKQRQDRQILVNVLEGRGPLRLLFAKCPGPSQRPFVFPYRVSQIRQQLDGLIVQSNLLSRRDLISRGRKWSELHPQSSQPRLLENWHMVCPATSSGKEVEEWLLDGRGAPEAKPGVLVLQLKTFHYCCIYLLGHTNATREDLARLLGGEWAALQKELLTQVQVIDKWLQENAADIIDCRRYTLSVTAAVIQDLLEWRPALSEYEKRRAETAINKGPDEESSKYWEIHANLRNFQGRLGLSSCREANSLDTSLVFETIRRMTEQTGPGEDEGMNDFWRRLLLDSVYKTSRIWKDKPKRLKGRRPAGDSEDPLQHPLDDLLIYRTICMAIIYAMAVDNSSIVENKSYEQVIPFL